MFVLDTVDVFGETILDRSKRFGAHGYNCATGGRAGQPSFQDADLQPGRSTECYGSGMSKTITQRELRNESGEIMRLLDQGETFTVTRNGVPVGELAPLRRHRFVTADAAIAMFRNAPHVDADRFRADLDAIADQDSNPRA